MTHITRNTILASRVLVLTLSVPSESATPALACTLYRLNGGSSSICRRYVTFVCVYTDVCERGLHELRCCAAPAQDKRPDITPTHSYCASMNSCDTRRTCSYRSTLHESDHTRTGGVQNYGLKENRPRGVHCCAIQGTLAGLNCTHSNDM